MKKKIYEFELEKESVLLIFPYLSGSNMSQDSPVQHSHLDIFSRKMKICLHINLYTNVYNNSIYNCQNMEKLQKSLKA